MLIIRSITNQFDDGCGRNTLSVICEGAVRHPRTGYPLP